MAEHHASGRAAADRVRLRVLAVLVALVTVVGVVALVLNLGGTDSTTASKVASQPPGRPVDDRSGAVRASTAVSAPPVTPVPPVTSVPSTPAAPTTASRPATPTGATTRIVRYTVRRGDNLTVIAAWFHQRGYGLLYDWNKSVIGRDPNLIFPGQTIIVSLTGDRMDVRAARD